MSSRNEHKLDDLFVAYRDSFPDREPTVNFTPELWRRIDQRRKVTFGLTRFTRGIVTGALALCFFMTAVNWTPSSSNYAYSSTYIDILDEEGEQDLDVNVESL